MLSIYNKVSEYIMVLNLEAKIIFCNNNFQKKLNYLNEEILNFNILEIIDNKTSLHDLKKQQNIVLKFHKKFHSEIYINADISIASYNNEDHIFIVGKDKNKPTYNMQMLEELLDNINTSAFIVDDKGKYLYVNKSFSDMLDKEKDEIIESYYSEQWNSETSKNFQMDNQEVFSNGSPKLFNKKVIINERIYWYETFKAPMYDKDKNPRYIVATAKNINLTKVLSEELYKNYNRLAVEDYLRGKENYENNLGKILSNIGKHILEYTKADGLSIMLYDNNIEALRPFINLEKSVLKIKEKEFIKLTKDELEYRMYKDKSNCVLSKDKLPEPLNDTNLDVDELNYFGNYTIELRNEFIGIIGLSYINNNSPKFNCDEYMKFICNKIAMIIKNERLTREVLIENKKRRYTELELERYLNISVDLVATVGKDGYIKRLSRNWTNVLGWSEDELLSMHITDIIHPKELKVFEVEKKDDYLTGMIIRNIIRFRHKNGNYIYLEWSSEYISKEEIYVTTARDITKTLKIEKENKKLTAVIKSEVAKNEFFSNISHEFKTPINILLGATQVIEKNLEKNNIKIDSLKKYSKYIRQNSYRLLRLVNNLIDINKMDMGAYELKCSNQNIISIIEDITQSVVVYTKNNKINLIFDTDEEEVITYCDPDKIERIMLNLLSNAIKYTPESGFIKVDITTTDKEIRVSVKDNGIGIPKEKVGVIFDRFEQVDASLNRKCEGSGIGLSIVKNLIEMHGGEIRVESKINEGTEFIFTMPIKINKDNSYEECCIDRKSQHVERCNIEFSDIYIK